jgi:antitoxin component YwqK of YwqJK toxin-antitoxin module
LYLTGAYKNGKLNGKFNIFYRDGVRKMNFEYNNGQRSGLWESFSRNGETIKKVLYENQNEFLLELYNELGEPLVQNGNGKFIDSLYMSISGTQKSKITGNAKSGLPDGEWNFYVDNTNYGKEYFENFTFKKGISISQAFENEFYYDHFNSTFMGIVYLEHLKIIGPKICKKNLILV